jgi:hypothetical protein
MAVPKATAVNPTAPRCFKPNTFSVPLALASYGGNNGFVDPAIPIA